MLIMVSVIRVGQSKFVTVPIDEDSNERIMNCIQTLSDLGKERAVQEIFLKDTKAAYSKMIVAQEVRIPTDHIPYVEKLTLDSSVEKGSREESSRGGEKDCDSSRRLVDLPSVLEKGGRRHNRRRMAARTPVLVSDPSPGTRRRQQGHWCGGGPRGFHLESQQDLSAYWFLGSDLCRGLCQGPWLRYPPRYASRCGHCHQR